jgi:hypothetical protein
MRESRRIVCTVFGSTFGFVHQPVAEAVASYCEGQNDAHQGSAHPRLELLAGDGLQQKRLEIAAHGPLPSATDLLVLLHQGLELFLPRWRRHRLRLHPWLLSPLCFHRSTCYSHEGLRKSKSRARFSLGKGDSLSFESTRHYRARPRKRG